MPEGFMPVDRVRGKKEALADMAFKISCPPDVPARSRVVAVCGVTDDDNEASPSNDGWFFSDFYLFHHLMSPMRQTPNSSVIVTRTNIIADIRTEAQFWLTTEAPEKLVEKYGEYAHGDPRKERKVVLDKHTLEPIKLAGNIRVVPREALLERFLSTLREQATIASQRKEQLIVFIFGHGDLDTHGVYLGKPSGRRDQYPDLLIQDFRRALPPDVNVTLFITSCYSGGWLVEPRVNKKVHLNLTGITGSGPGEETRSWSVSRSIGRACGSSVASAIMQTIIGVDEEGDQGQEVYNHPTYMGLAARVFETISKIHSLADEQNIHFSAQDDEWEVHFGKRTGFPLKSFKEGWDSLRSIPPSNAYSLGDNANPAATIRKTASKKHRELQYRAREYLSSKPGRDSLGNNVSLHGRLRRFLRGEDELNSEQVLTLLDIVLFRLVRLQEADEYVQSMGISMPSSKSYNIEDWKGSPEQRRRFTEVATYLRKVRLFERPLPGPQWQYSKPLQYVSIALVESCETFEEVQEKVSMALDSM